MRKLSVCMVLMALTSLLAASGCGKKEVLTQTPAETPAQPEKPQLKSDDIVSSNTEFYPDGKTPRLKTEKQRDGRGLKTHYRPDGTKELVENFGPKGDYVNREKFDATGKVRVYIECISNGVRIWDSTYAPNGDRVGRSYQKDGVTLSSKTVETKEKDFTEYYARDGKTVVSTHQMISRDLSVPYKARMCYGMDKNGQNPAKVCVREYTWGPNGFSMNSYEKPKPYFIDTYLRADETVHYRQTICSFASMEPKPGIYEGVQKVEEMAADGKTIKRTFHLKLQSLRLKNKPIVERIVDIGDDGTTTVWELRKDHSLFRKTVSETDGTVTELETFPRGTKLPPEAAFDVSMVECFFHTEEE